MDTPITEQRWRAEVPDWRHDDDVSPHPSDVYITDTQGWQTTVAWVRAEGLGWACRTVSAGCVCPSPEFTAERVAARRAWLAAGRLVGAHLDDCFPCSLDWVPNCPEGMALREAVDAAWERYEETGR